MEPNDMNGKKWGLKKWGQIYFFWPIRIFLE